MAQRLTADSYWQKVNEVYASGQGDVAMAFVKDELGNWDLKSFSNDPGKLLASYRNVTNAALKTAADLVQSAGTGSAGKAVERLGRAAKAAALANQLATGEVAGDAGLPGGVDLKGLHDGVVARIAAQKTRFLGVQQRLTTERDAAKATAAQAEAARLDQEAAITAQQQHLAQARYDKALDQFTQASVARRAKEQAGGDASAERAAEAQAQEQVSGASSSLGSFEQELRAAEAARDAAAVKKAEAEAKAAADQQRLDDLPREAADAVRGALDDHLGVLAALQEGLGGSPPPTAAGPAPALPSR
jgi:hypothetical protein